MINKPLDKKLFNIDILVLNKDNTSYIQEVTSLATFETNSKVPNKNGLFSETIFGQRGSTIRNTRPAFVDLGIPILHPLIYDTFIGLDSKLESLMSGKLYATFDKTTKRFIFNSDKSGNTGYTYFIDNMENLEFDNISNSTQRDYKIKLVKKYGKKEAMMDKWLILPAGLRDIEEKDGRPTEDEINTIYRKLIATASMVKNTKITPSNYKLLDPIRLKLQNIVLELFNYIKSLLDGKHKFIQSKYSKRAITHGTRNVITGLPTSITDLSKKNNIGFNHTIVGLYQYVKAISPIAINKVQTKFINNVLSPTTTSAYLVNPKTLKTELVEISVKKRDEWLTTQGMNDIMNKLSQSDLRFEPVMIDKYYLCLLLDTGKNIEIYKHTDDIPTEVDRKKLRPITYAELFYISVLDVKDKYKGFVTRYPVTSLGSIYPTKIYLKTTINSRTVNLIFNNTEQEVVEYPIIDELFFESMSVNTSRIKRLGGDYDGDVCSLTVLYTKEATEEINKHLDNVNSYITPEGNIAYSCNDDNIELVVTELTE